MKIKYPDYRSKGTSYIKASFKPKDNKILEDFIEYCCITAGEKKLKNIEAKMLQIKDVIQKSYSSITLKDLRGFLSVLNKSNKLKETQNDIKKVLKRFLKWYYKDWNERFAEFKDIKTTNGFNEEKINANTLLKPEEIEKLIRGAESLRYKALIMLMFESAGRPEEILKLKWSDVDFNRKEVKLHSSKTSKTRVNPINESVIHLQRYKQEYPFVNIRADDYIFPSPENRKKPVTTQAIDLYIKDLGFRVLDRAIFPYLIRHTRLTQIHKTLPTQVACKFAGHSTEIAKRYTHLTNDDVREAMLEKIYHIEELTEKEKEEVKKLKQELKNQKEAHNLLAETTFKEFDKINKHLKNYEKMLNEDIKRLEKK